MIIRLCSVPLLCLAVLLSVGCGKDSKGGSGNPTVKDGLPDDKKPKQIDPAGPPQKDKGTDKAPPKPGPKPE